MCKGCGHGACMAQTLNESTFGCCTNVNATVELHTATERAVGDRKISKWRIVCAHFIWVVTTNTVGCVVVPCLLITLVKMLSPKVATLVI